MLIGACAVFVYTFVGVVPAGAEELHYKFYTWVMKSESLPVGREGPGLRRLGGAGGAGRHRLCPVTRSG